MIQLSSAPAYQLSLLHQVHVSMTMCRMCQCVNSPAAADAVIALCSCRVPLGSAGVSRSGTQARQRRVFLVGFRAGARPIGTPPGVGALPDRGRPGSLQALDETVTSSHAGRAVVW